MKKYFTKDKLLSFSNEKKLRALYDLSIYIESNEKEINSKSFLKLYEYHQNLKDCHDESIQKINKEFFKVKRLDYQYQVYLMNLERLLGQSKKDYDFLIQRTDSRTNSSKHPISCLLDSVRSAHNVGAFFRNSESFGSSHLYLCGLTPTPEIQQVQKTSMGSIENMSWTYEKSAVDLVKDLKEKGHNIWAIETGKESIPIHKVTTYPKELVLLFGHEQFGLSLELLQAADKIISINLSGVKNSLNVSVSQAIVLNHLTNID